MPLPACTPAVQAACKKANKKKAMVKRRESHQRATREAMKEEAGGGLSSQNTPTLRCFSSYFTRRIAPAASASIGVNKEKVGTDWVQVARLADSPFPVFRL